MIKLSDIKMIYGEQSVLDIPELTFDNGGRYAVLGTGGSGKTTLLRILAGTLQQSTGSISLPKGLAQDRAFMPQRPYIFPFSVLKNVTLALDKGEESRAEALDALSAVGMEAFVETDGRKLSASDIQRVAIARLIAQPRRLLLLDEPISAAEMDGSETIEAALRDYCEHYGCTMIFTTSSPAQAMRLANRVILLHQGRIVLNGPTDVIKNFGRSSDSKS